MGARLIDMSDEQRQELQSRLAASERRLTRLGYDLHDGPLQQLLLLAEDLELFRAQLAGVLGAAPEAAVLSGRLDDLAARMLALEDGLRRVSGAATANEHRPCAFEEALREIVDAFAVRTGIVPELACEGDFGSVSESQRLAVLGVVGEALNNVREHGEASAVSIFLALGDDGLVARVRDDGRGFDVERELVRAARSGHMGLAGMHERVRLLDGRCRVESRPGGPTVVSLALPHWRAGQAASQAGAARAAG